jgi:hypothetical protein
LSSSGVLPLVKYQSETRAAISRAARELPPWKISICGFCTGLGGQGVVFELVVFHQYVKIKIPSA